MAEFTFGIYCPGDPIRRDEAPGTASGTINIVEAPPEFLVETQRIPAVPGVGFGILVGLKPGAVLDATVTVRHPPFTGSGVTEEFWVTNLDDSPSLNGFTFEHAYELQPGLWTYSAAVEGIEIYRIDFEVVEPSAAPELAGICAGAILS